MTVEEKKIRHLYLRVYPPDGQVHMTVPRGTPMSRIRAFAVSRMAWIVETRQKFANRPIVSENHAVTGERILLFGCTYRLKVMTVPSRGQVYCEGERVVMQAPAGAGEAQRKLLLERFYRYRLAQEIPSRLAVCERHQGVRADSWYLRDMKTRWGTCNVRTGRICLNLHLVHYPPECLDYVLTHELCHLTEPSHNARFYALMNRYFPVWREVKRALNTPLPAEEKPSDKN